MWLAKMAWKNIWRNRNRTAITMSAIFFAVILSILTSSLKDGVFNNLVKNVVGFYTGYVQIHKQGYWDEQVLDNCMEASPKSINQILGHSNVASIASRLESFGLISSGDLTKGVMVVGIEPEKENLITSLKNRLVSGGYLLNEDRSVLLAKGLADQLRLKVNDTIVLIGQGYHGSTAAGKYRVKGIVQFGSPDLNDKILYMPLTTAQDFFSAYNMITSYTILLHNINDLSSTASEIRASLGREYEVMTWADLLPNIKQHIASDSNSMKFIQGILYMLVCFGILSTLLMMMIERKYEMGMLVAIGMKKLQLIFLLVMESLLTVLAGCFLGIMASIPLVYYLNKNPLKMGGETARAYERFGFEAIFPASTDPGNFFNQGLIVIAFGLAMSLYPIYKVIRMNPLTAMKQ
ncbi:MAG: ABC transporter permease [Chitinophagaceae bacterium]|nr:ABC transporter permease [Chitinophagaceae bacterium]